MAPELLNGNSSRVSEKVIEPFILIKFHNIINGSFGWHLVCGMTFTG
jgi:hypothetical protein